MQYGEIALVYDSLMYDIPYEDWAKFIGQNLKGRSVLELGCGTGSITEKLCAYYDITALDFSEDMLDIAREKLMKKGRMARFIKGDMRDFKVHKPFENVIIVCDGINYLTSLSDVKKTFLNVFDNLLPGGRFIFDISSQYKLKNMAGQLYSEDADEATYIWRNTMEGDIITMDITFFVAEDDTHYFRFDETHLQRAHSIEEISALLCECGFEIISVTDNYTNNAVRDDSMRITFCAEKKG